MSYLNFEYQYLESLKHILANGEISDNRTGIDTISVQHQYFYIKDVYKNFPILKGKKLFPYMSVTETLWFLQGRTDVKFLNDHGVSYWNKWVNKEGTIGKSYGYQFRNGSDQLTTLLNNIIKSPNSRRLILNLWNVEDLKDMTLEPCVYDFHFHCSKIKNFQCFIDMHVKQRSADMFLGFPYDAMNAGILLSIICDYLSLITNTTYKPRDIHYTTDDTHIYKNHYTQVYQYINNVEENKFNVINQETKLKFNTFNDHMFNTIDDYVKFYLDSFDDKKYGAIEFDRKWNHIYQTIPAEVAV